MFQNLKTIWIPHTLQGLETFHSYIASETGNNLHISLAFHHSPFHFKFEDNSNNLLRIYHGMDAFLAHAFERWQQALSGRLRLPSSCHYREYYQSIYKSFPLWDCSPSGIKLFGFFQVICRPVKASSIICRSWGLFHVSRMAYHKQYIYLVCTFCGKFIRHIRYFTFMLYDLFGLYCRLQNCKTKIFFFFQTISEIFFLQRTIIFNE